MKLIHAERNGDAFDSQLVIGVRESYVNLCSDIGDKLEIYRDNFEASYLQVCDNIGRSNAFCFSNLLSHFRQQQHFIVSKLANNCKQMESNRSCNMQVNHVEIRNI